MKKLSPFAFLIGLALLFILAAKLDLGRSWEILKQAKIPWILAAIAFCVPEVLLKAARLKLLARRLKSRLSFWDACFIYLSGQPLASATPAKLGDVLRVLFLTRRGRLTTVSALSLHTADKIYDLASLALWASVGLLALTVGSQHHGPFLAALGGVGLGVALILLLLNRQWMSTLFKPVVMSLAPRKMAEDLSHHSREFYRNLEPLTIPSPKLLLPFSLSLAAWLTTVVRAYFCAQALSLPLSFSTLALLLPSVIMVEFLPVSVMGFGTREAALFAFLASDLLPKEALLSFSLLTVIVGPLATSLAGIPAASQLSSAVPPKP